VNNAEEIKKMAIFPSLPDPTTMADVFRAFPHTIRPLVEYHDRLLRDRSPLTVGQRELIAAYVSGVNACTYCHGAHTMAARAFGVDETVFEGLMTSLDAAAVDEKMKPILKYVGKLTRTPSRMTEADAQAVYDAGWDEQALFDAVSVCALFNFMNRIVEGAGIKGDFLRAPPEEQKAHMKRFSGGEPRARDDAHEAPHQYTKLLALWGIEGRN
jgi:uncharacterized peroxidase-related enzyme